jgi:hypothetical protein
VSLDFDRRLPIVSQCGQKGFSAILSGLLGNHHKFFLEVGCSTLNDVRADLLSLGLIEAKLLAYVIQEMLWVRGSIF